MTEIPSSAAPPPPPPPAPPHESGFDFGKPFTFVFEDPRWVTKVLVGGLFYLLAMLIVGMFFLAGYVAQLVRNVVAGERHPLPEWDQLGDYFVEGLKLVVISFIYMVPFIFIWIIPFIFIGAAEGTIGEDAAGGMAGLVLCFGLPLMLLAMIWIPAALLRTVVTGRFDQAFNFSAIGGFIRDNFGNYLLAIVVYLVANFLSQFGILLFCIGVIFTAFWSMCATAHGFAQAWRLQRS